ncbi:MAG TPA: hypothetical protein VIG33_15665 [Pseudobdellovibrionaceae bacterium]|jgi:hypothetical protein
MKKILLSMSAILFLQPALAHEGHDVAPGALKALHGGSVLAGKEINLEYIVTSNQVKLYPLSHEGKDLEPSQIKVKATAKAPRGKSENLKVELKEGALTTQVDFKNAYRVEVNVNTETNGKKDSFKFQVEK